MIFAAGVLTGAALALTGAYRALAFFTSSKGWG